MKRQLFISQTPGPVLVDAPYERVIGGRRMFASRGRGRRWEISEYSTGALISTGTTLREAWEAGLKASQRYSAEVLKHRLAKHIRRFGVANKD